MTITSLITLFIPNLLMPTYEELLQRAKKAVAKGSETGRFAMPKPELMEEGAKTIIKNFASIASTFRRKEEHIFKFYLKELAVPGELKGGRASFTGNFVQRQMDEKLKEYARLFVLCYSCGKPDTVMVSEDGQEKLKCEACGSKGRIRG